MSYCTITNKMIGHPANGVPDHFISFSVNTG